MGKLTSGWRDTHEVNLADWRWLLDELERQPMTGAEVMQAAREAAMQAMEKAVELGLVVVETQDVDGVKVSVFSPAPHDDNDLSHRFGGKS